MINNLRHQCIKAHTDAEYLEELIGDMLYIDASSVLNVNTFSEVGLRYEGRGLLITFEDGAKYRLSITRE